MTKQNKLVDDKARLKSGQIFSKGESSNAILEDIYLFFKEVLSKKIIAVFIFFCLIFLLSWQSYGKAFDYYIWRDEAKVVWLHNHMPSRMYRIDVEAASRGRVGAILFDYLSYTILGTSPEALQTFGFVIRLINSLLVFFLAAELFRSRRVGVVASILFAGFIG